MTGPGHNAGPDDRPDFERALAVVLEHEGGFVDDRHDPGGATNWGVSLRYLRALGDLELGDVDGDGDIDADDIRAMTRDQAARIYRQEFWDRYGYGDFLEHRVAAKTFDLVVNMGPRPGHRILQRALRSAAGIVLVDDGLLGRKTEAALRAAWGSPVHVAMRSEAAGFYRSLVAEKPKFDRYLTGWLRRAYD